MARDMVKFVAGAAIAAVAVVLEGCTENQAANISLVCGELTAEGGKYSFKCADESCGTNAKACDDALLEAIEECSVLSASSGSSGVESSSTSAKDSGSSVASLGDSESLDGDDAFDERKAFAEIFKSKVGTRGAKVRPTLSRVFHAPPGVGDSLVRGFPYEFSDDELMPSDMGSLSSGSREEERRPTPQQHAQALSTEVEAPSGEGSAASSPPPEVAELAVAQKVSQVPERRLASAMNLCMSALPWPAVAAHVDASTRNRRGVWPSERSVVAVVAASSALAGVFGALAAVAYRRLRGSRREVRSAPAVELGSVALSA